MRVVTTVHMVSKEHVIPFYLLSIRFPDWESHLQFWELEQGPRGVPAPGDVRYAIFEFWKSLLSKPEQERRNLFRQERARGKWRMEVEREVSAYLPDFDHIEASGLNLLKRGIQALQFHTRVG
jgi:hypothetical protein